MHFSLLSYNIRKGKGASGFADAFGSVLRAMEEEMPDILLCQEVFHASREDHAQSALLAEALGLSVAYEPNKHRRIGHHGNATLSHFPIISSKNHDLSVNRIERRGVLHTLLKVKGAPVHILNVHLGLTHRQRVRQLAKMADLVERTLPPNDAIVLAGDFNDWRGRLDPVIRELGFENAVNEVDERLVRTFPPRRPRWPLDRVYVRKIRVESASVLDGGLFEKASDHLPIAVRMSL
jgi:endonuclease/exonuclease/phosphatase family metal-dependent hydrolase